MDQTLYLDFYDIIVNTLIGELKLFVIIGLIVLILVAAKLKFNFTTTFILAILYFMVLNTKMYLSLAYVFILLIVGIIFYLAIAKKIKG